MSDAGHLTELALRVAALGGKPTHITIPENRVALAEAAGLQVSRILQLRVRHVHHSDPGELAYIRSTFAEGYKQSSNRLDKLTWPDFKRLERPKLDAVLARADTQLLVADLEGMVAGWLAWTPGRRVDTVHWTHARHQLRKHGVMRALVDAAGLKARLVYTHRGAKRSDNWIVPWLGRRGINAAFVPMKEWIE